MCLAPFLSHSHTPDWLLLHLAAHPPALWVGTIKDTACIIEKAVWFLFFIPFFSNWKFLKKGRGHKSFSPLLKNQRSCNTPLFSTFLNKCPFVSKALAPYSTLSPLIWNTIFIIIKLWINFIINITFISTNAYLSQQYFKLLKLQNVFNFKKWQFLFSVLIFPKLICFQNLLFVAIALWI